MLAACARAGVNMAVSHQGRLHPATLHTQRLLREGAIGRLRLVRGYGKMDQRGGGQDLMVLGTHVLDLMRLFAGDAAWASADLLAGSRLTEAADVRAGDEEIGPIAGDGLRATYGFADGVIGHFESFARLGQGEDLFGLELVGETGQLSLRGGFTKRLLRYPRPFILPGAPDDRWEVLPVPEAGPGEVLGDSRPAPADLVQRANQRLVRDLLAAVEAGREPASSGQRARAALELIQAVAAAHAAGGRVTLPLVQREHPFAALPSAATAAR
jgi:predicted dehydrogenase